MNANNETNTTENVPAAISTTEAVSSPAVIPDPEPAVPAHILDFCNRVFPSHYGSAYDGRRAHLIAQRMHVEREAAANYRQDSNLPSIPSTESILSTLKSQSQQQAEQTRNDAETQPEQRRNEAETEAEQTRNSPGTDPEQQPEQNTQPAANQPKHKGHQSKIDALPPETREFVVNLLASHSLDETLSILSGSVRHPEARKLSRSCLHRYRRSLRREQARARAAETQELVNELLANPRTPDDQLAEAIRHIFHTRLLETINDPACPLEDTLKALQTSERFRQNSIAEKRMAAKKEIVIDEIK